MHPILKNYFNFIKGFIPEKPRGSSVGLDIGAGECKLVELDKTEDSYELLSYDIEAVEDNDVASTVRNMLSRLKNPTKSVYTAVSGKGTLIRYINMPRMSLEDLQNSFAIEADKYFPFSQDQIHTDCYILDPNAKGKQMAVMAAAAKIELIEERMKLLSSLEVSTDFVGINSIAVANAINTLSTEEEEPKDVAVALLDFGESVSSLTIFVNRLPRFNRDIFIGGRDFTKSISNALGITIKEAEKIKKDSKDKEKEIVSACESVYLSVVNELRLSFDYFLTENSYDLVKLCLTGGSSMMQGLSDSLEKALELDVSTWNPIDHLKLSSEINEEEIKKKSLKLGVALGLALYNYD